MPLIRKTFAALTLCLLFIGHSTFAQQVIKPLFEQPEWSKPAQPFRIAGNLYYVGTYDLGCYLITTPKGHILINTGLANSADMIKANVEALGFKFSDIRILLATHAHYDHVGAMATIKKMTGAKLMINKRDVPLMEDGGNSDYIMGGKGSTFLPTTVDRALGNNDIVSLDSMHIQVLSHPGHTKGANSFLFTVKDSARSYRVLIANMPSILDETKLSGMPNYPDVGKDYAYTLHAMKGLKFDLWLASHASQFDLHIKHPDGSPYNPQAFHDPTGYAEALADLQKTYNKRLKEKK